MYLLIDNYDSFTYNLYHYFLELGVKIKVYRNDKITPWILPFVNARNWLETNA